MANKRTWKKRRKLELENKINKMNDTMVEVEKVLQKVYVGQLEANNKKEKDYILQLIQIREMLCSDLRRYGDNACDDLKTYIDEVTNILENDDVEILRGQVMDCYDREVMRSLKRHMVREEKYHNKVYKVHRDGYRRNGKMISYMNVETMFYES